VSQLIPVYIIFENSTCNIGSQLDGGDLYEIVRFDERYDDVNVFYCYSVPRKGETLELSCGGGRIWFEVVEVLHKLHPTHPDLSCQTAELLVRQIPLDDPRLRW